LVGLVEDALGQGLQGVRGVGVVDAIGQEAAVLGVGDEQKAEQHDHGPVVGLVERRSLLRLRQLGGVLGSGHRDGECGDDILVDAVPQALGEAGGPTGGVAEELRHDATGLQRLRGEQQGEVSGLVLREQGEVDFGERLGLTLAADTDVRVDGEQPDDGAAVHDQPVDSFASGDCQAVGDGIAAVEPGQRVVEGLVVGQQYRGRPSGSVAGVTQDDSVLDGLHGVPEAGEQAVATAREQRLGAPAEVVPVRPVGLLREHVGGEQALVAEARPHTADQRRQPAAHVRMKPEWAVDREGVRDEALGQGSLNGTDGDGVVG